MNWADYRVIDTTLKVSLSEVNSMKVLAAPLFFLQFYQSTICIVRHPCFRGEHHRWTESYQDRLAPLNLHLNAIEGAGLKLVGMLEARCPLVENPEEQVMMALFIVKSKLFADNVVEVDPATPLMSRWESNSGSSSRTNSFYRELCAEWPEDSPLGDSRSAT